jgi:hypothetical protein
MPHAGAPSSAACPLKIQAVTAILQGRAAFHFLQCRIHSTQPHVGRIKQSWIEGDVRPLQKPRKPYSSAPAATRRPQSSSAAATRRGQLSGGCRASARGSPPEAPAGVSSALAATAATPCTAPVPGLGPTCHTAHKGLQPRFQALDCRLQLMRRVQAGKAYLVAQAAAHLVWVRRALLRSCAVTQLIMQGRHRALCAMLQPHRSKGDPG